MPVPVVDGERMRKQQPRTADTPTIPHLLLAQIVESHKNLLVHANMCTGHIFVPSRLVSIVPFLNSIVAEPLLLHRRQEATKPCRHQSHAMS